MCGRFSELVDPMVLEDVLALADSLCTFTPRTTVAPSQRALVVVQALEGNVLKEMRWGLIPHWADDERIGAKLFNARCETADQKPAFGRHGGNGVVWCRVLGFMNGDGGKVGKGTGSACNRFIFNDRIEGCFVLPVSGSVGSGRRPGRASCLRIPLRHRRRSWKPLRF